MVNRNQQKIQVNTELKEKLLIQAATDLMTRRAYMANLGMSFNGNRDIYEALGYKKILTFDDYYVKYDRQDIATRIVDAPVDGCWSAMPKILEVDKKDDTEFETELLDIAKRVKLFPKIVRLDKLCGIGQYSVLFLGFDGTDATRLNQPLEEGKKNLLYVQPYSEAGAQIVEWEQDSNSERFGLPKMYNLKVTSPVPGSGTQITKEVKVHHSRVIHICEGNLIDDVYGQPRLKNVYNRLEDIEKIVGGSGEMFWQGAFPGMALKADADADMTGTADAITEEIDKYVHKMQRYMKLKGIDVQQLSPNISDPTSCLTVNVKMISAAKGIPVRILLGSERGELASSQDEKNWIDQLAQRREDHCEGMILRPLVDKLISVGAITSPKTGYELDWEPLYIRSDVEKADVASKRADALSKYTSGGLDMLMTFTAYLEHVCEFDAGVVEMIIKSGEEVVGSIVDEETQNIDESVSE